MYAEITKQAFNVLLFNSKGIDNVENKELTTVTTYKSNGVRCQTIHNFISDTVQYYVMDINS
jgi:hypothetical protein